MYDLTQIPYNYTVEVTNRFKVDRVPEELWMEVCDTVQEVHSPMISACQSLIIA